MADYHKTIDGKDVRGGIAPSDIQDAVTDIVGDGTIPLAFCLQATLLRTNWAASGDVWEYNYTNSAINEHSVAQVIPHNDYLNISRAAILLPANSSYNGGLKIYAANQANGDINVNINVFGDGVEPSEPVQPSGSRNIDGGSANSVYLPSQVINGGNANG